MAETPETPTPSLADELERCGWALHLELPAAVAVDVQKLTDAAAAQLRQLDRIKAALGPVWTADEIRWAVGDGRVPKMAYYPLSDMLLRLADALEADDGA